MPRPPSLSTIVCRGKTYVAVRAFSILRLGYVATLPPVLSRFSLPPESCMRPLFAHSSFQKTRAVRSTVPTLTPRRKFLNVYILSCTPVFFFSFLFFRLLNTMSSLTQNLLWRTPPRFRGRIDAGAERSCEVPGGRTIAGYDRWRQREPEREPQQERQRRRARR